MRIFLKLKIVKKTLKCSGVNHNQVRKEFTRITSLQMKHPI